MCRSTIHASELWCPTQRLSPGGRVTIATARGLQQFHHTRLSFAQASKTELKPLRSTREPKSQFKRLHVTVVLAGRRKSETPLSVSRRADISTSPCCMHGNNHPPSRCVRNLCQALLQIHPTMANTTRCVLSSVVGQSAGPRAGDLFGDPNAAPSGSGGADSHMEGGGRHHLHMTTGTAPAMMPADPGAFLRDRDATGRMLGRRGVRAGARRR